MLCRMMLRWFRICWINSQNSGFCCPELWMTFWKRSVILKWQNTMAFLWAVVHWGITAVLCMKSVLWLLYRNSSVRVWHLHWSSLFWKDWKKAVKRQEFLPWLIRMFFSAVWVFRWWKRIFFPRKSGAIAGYVLKKTAAMKLPCFWIWMVIIRNKKL